MHLITTDHFSPDDTHFPLHTYCSSLIPVEFQWSQPFSNTKMPLIYHPSISLCHLLFLTIWQSPHCLALIQRLQIGKKKNTIVAAVTHWWKEDVSQPILCSGWRKKKRILPLLRDIRHKCTYICSREQRDSCELSPTDRRALGCCCIKHSCETHVFLYPGSWLGYGALCSGHVGLNMPLQESWIEIFGGGRTMEGPEQHRGQAKQTFTERSCTACND